MTYGASFSRPLGVDNKGKGGAALKLGIEGLAGETELVTVHDDFDGVLPTTTFGAVSAADGTVNTWEENGWVFTDVGAPTNDEVGMQDPADVDQWYPSCIRIFSGDADDAGGNMQLDFINSTGVGTYLGSTTNDLTFTRYPFRHLWIPETAAGAAVIDNTVWVFACRIGLRADLTTTGSGDWDSKCFIGWAEAGDTAILTAASGAITQPETGPLVGFHIPEDGSIDGICQRTVNTTYAEGTNLTELVAAGGVDGTVANGSTTAGDTVWFDLALRMVVTNMSDNTDNGFTQFFSRRLSPKTFVNASDTHPFAGEFVRWNAHETTLLNQTPNNDVALVPTIEMVNGGTAGRDGVLFLDSWTFGVSRLALR